MGQRRRCRRGILPHREAVLLPPQYVPPIFCRPFTNLTQLLAIGLKPFPARPCPSSQRRYSRHPPPGTQNNLPAISSVVFHTQKRHGVWTCPTCKHQPFSPLGLPPRIPKHHQQQPPTSPRKTTGGGGGDLTTMPPKDALQPRAMEEHRLEVAAAAPFGESNGAVATGVPTTTPSSPSKGGGGGGGGDGNPAAGGRNRSTSVGSGYSVGDGGGDGGSGEVSRRTGRQRVAKKFGDEFDEVRTAGHGCPFIVRSHARGCPFYRDAS